MFHEIFGGGVILACVLFTIFVVRSGPPRNMRGMAYAPRGGEIIRVLPEHEAISVGWHDPDRGWLIVRQTVTAPVVETASEDTLKGWWPLW